MECCQCHVRRALLPACHALLPSALTMYSLFRGSAGQGLYLARCLIFLRLRLSLRCWVGGGG